MYITDALILRKDPAGEADVLVTALTPRLVKVRLLAQGARKVEAKLKGHLEPFSLSRVSFITGRNGYRLVGAELIDFFPNIKNDFERLGVAHDIAQSLESALFEDRGEESPEFFSVAREAVAALNIRSLSVEEINSVLLWFRMRFLDSLGLLPEREAESAGTVEFGSVRSISCADFLRMPGEEYSGAAAKLWRTHAAEFSASVVQ